jgi:hypothetical protein
MKIFKRDITGQLEKARTDKVKVEARLVDLQQQRLAALVEADELGAIEAIDKQIEAQHRTITILADRIAALQAIAPGIPGQCR